MKALVALLILLGAAVTMLSLQSFRSRYFETTYSPAFTLPVGAPTTTTSTPPPGSGGAPRKPRPTSTAPTSSNPTGFKGPSGPPTIVGPTAPPPGQ